MTQFFNMVTGESVFLSVKFDGVTSIQTPTVTGSGVTITQVSAAQDTIRALISASGAGTFAIRFVAGLADSQVLVQPINIIVT
jgi:hypothetical protein